jgi:SAM-dependent methyltransferase
MESQAAYQTQSTPKRELVLGAGNAPEKKVYHAHEGKHYQNPIRLDIDERCDPDVLWDLNDRPLPFDDGEFDEIHAYEVLEHLGRQGDWRGFFEEWNEYYRLLKPGGHFVATVPSTKSVWLWADPGHTRVICNETLTFLDRMSYEDQVGKTTMTDYRQWYHGDFLLLWDDDNGTNYSFVLEKRDGKEGQA